MKFFIREAASYNPKNRLHDAVYDELVKLDGTLVHGRDTLEKLLTDTEMKVEKLCTEYTRCKPVKLRIHRQKMDKVSPPADVNVPGLIHLYVSEVKKEVPNV